ncbi:MAG: fumarate hydratase [Candidatus Omnitrophica bacterium]|nr:fumarate hydratase [Candidatus Omnitrophota bacterium]
MSTRKINVREIEKKVKDLCAKANIVLRPDVNAAILKAYRSKNETFLAKKMLKILLENARVAKEEKLPICQDTGITEVFIKIGEKVILTGGNLTNAVNRGIKKAYAVNYFRKSVVRDPLLRKNTRTNTPGILHVEITRGNKVKVTVMPKGFGSENKSALFMLNPTATAEEIERVSVAFVKNAGANACPPYVLGIGLGGTAASAAVLAKKALLRLIDKANKKHHLAELEKNIMKKANALKIGVMGLGGKTTVLGVNIEAAPTHIAGLPVAINLSCHALRSASATI